MKQAVQGLQAHVLESPPTRGAWIETIRSRSARAAERGRPPRGGRGLKLYPLGQGDNGARVAPHAGGVD